MDKQLTDTIASGLKAELISRFGISTTAINSISTIGQNSLTSGLKQFVMKNGTKDLESILLRQSSFDSSSLRSVLVKQLVVDLGNAQGLGNAVLDEVSGFSADFLVHAIVDGFQKSTFSKDFDGICAFIGIDKNLLKMVNSPVGKMFGKFF